jgi:hypothetical protein
MKERPQIVVRYNDDIVANRFEEDRDLLIEWVSAFVWDNFRGTGFELSIKWVDGHLRPDEWVETENLDDSWVLGSEIRHRFNPRVTEAA